MISSMDSTLESSMTQVICSFLMPKPTGTSLAAHSNAFENSCHMNLRALASVDTFPN